MDILDISVPNPDPPTAGRGCRTIPNGEVGDWQLGDLEFNRTFRLPGAELKTPTLALRNSMPRDERIRFEEEGHLYFVRNPSGEEVQVPLSVTSLISAYHEEFDPDKAIRVMRGGRNWAEKRKEFIVDGRDMTDEEIKEKWRLNGEVQSRRGTLMHYQIEQHLNGCVVEAPLSPEFQQFLVFAEQEMKARDLEPFLTEVSLFHCGLGVAGQADLLCRRPDGKIAILDWKRSKEIQRKGFAGRRMRAPLGTLQDCNFSHYALQLNLYRYILETEYEVEVGEMLLGVFHPNQEAPLLVEIPVLQEELLALVRHRMERGLAGEPVPGPKAAFRCFQADPEHE